MSREVTGNTLDDEAAEARLSSRRVVLRRAALLVVALVAAGWVLVRIGGGSGHLALPGPTPARTPPVVQLRAVLKGDGGVQGLDRLVGSLLLMNAGPEPVQVVDVAVLGLGTVIIPGADQVGTLATVDERTLALSVIPDCTVRLSGSVRIVATIRDGADVQTVAVATAATPEELLAVLDPVCPPLATVPLAVAISGVEANGDGTLAVRLVNNGRLHTQVVPLAAPDAAPARLVLDPKEPVPLSPGQAVVVRLGVDAPGCAYPPSGPAADALSLEARTTMGFTQVTGWPREAVARLIDDLAQRCARHET